MPNPRVVVDSNIWVSYLFFAKADIAEVGDFLVSGHCGVVASGAMLDELRGVLGRAKWDSYLSLEIRLEFYRAVHRLSEIIVPTSTITACRDPKDNMVLETAHDGRADFLVTGDQDLLELATRLDPDWSFRIVAPCNFFGELRNLA